MCGRVFSTLRRAELFRNAGTRTMNTNQSYSRNYNIGPRSFLPCIVHKTCPVTFNREEVEKQERLSDRQIIKPKSITKKSNSKKTYNPPSQSTPEEETKAVSKEKENRKIEIFKWGWEFKDFAMINCRGEEMPSKSFFQPYSKNRCVIMVEGIYEWNKDKQPHAYKPGKGNKDGCFFIAGIFNKSGQVLIATVEASEKVSKIHGRMPFVLTEEEIDSWIDPELEFGLVVNKLSDRNLKKFIDFEVHRVPTFVNKLKNKGVKNQMTLDEFKEHQAKNGGIMSFFNARKKGGKSFDELKKLKEEKAGKMKEAGKVKRRSSKMKKRGKKLGAREVSYLDGDLKKRKIRKSKRVRRN